MSTLEEIRYFGSPGEFRRFRSKIEHLVQIGALAELAADPDFQLGEIYGGRWFRHVDSGETWRLVEPDPPFKGLWARVVIRGLT